MHTRTIYLFVVLMIVHVESESVKNFLKLCFCNSLLFCLPFFSCLYYSLILVSKFSSSYLSLSSSFFVSYLTFYLLLSSSLILFFIFFFLRLLSYSLSSSFLDSKSFLINIYSLSHSK